MAASAWNLARLRRAAERRWSRLRKYVWQRRHLDASEPRHPVFVVGCQRSGTTMLISVLERSPRTWVHHEDSERAYHRFRLRPPQVVKRLIEKSPAPVVVFKPICDSHLVDQVLDWHPRGRAVWIYRRHQDVTNSALKKWGQHHREVMDGISAGQLEQLGWRGERLPEDAVALVRRLNAEPLSLHEAGTLWWYLRNRFFFELGLDRDPRVLLVRYEDLVREPAAGFSRIFDFMGCPLAPEFFAAVSTASIRKESFPEIRAELRSRVEALTERLDEAYARQERAERAARG